MLWMQEVGSGSTSQRSDEEDFVKVDDLPLQLTVMCEVCIKTVKSHKWGIAVKSLRDTVCNIRRSFRRE